MSILYSLIARDKTSILVDCATVGGNIEVVTQNLLQNIQNSPRLSITYKEEYFFHVINDGAFVYLCVADKTLSQSLAFKFLDELKDTFTKLFTAEERINALPNGFAGSFKQTLKQKITTYNSNPNNDQIQKINRNLEQLTDVMVKNIDTILQREQKIEMVLKKTYQMNQSSQFIKKQANQAQQDAYWKSMRVKIFIGLILIIAAVLGVVFFL